MPVQAPTPPAALFHQLKLPSAQLKADNDERREELKLSKQAEAGLRLTRFALDRAADAVFWLGEDARILYVNDQACRSLGYSAAELLSRTVHDIDPDFPREEWPERWRELKERGAFTLESRHRRKDGSMFPVEIAVNYFEFDGAEYNCAFARDITDRKNAEGSLRESERHFRVLAESTAAG